MPKQVMFDEIRDDKRPVAKPRKRYKHCVKEPLKKAGTDPKTWQEKTKDRELQRDEVMQVVKEYEERWSDYAKVKRAAKYGVVVTPRPRKVLKIMFDVIFLVKSVCLGLTRHTNTDTAAFLVNFICTVRGRICSIASG